MCSIGINLNPDCTVKEGIVITENVTKAIAILQSRNVVILKGVIGCGKTYALNAIQNHFQERNWETLWVSSENVEEEISYEKPTILLCDNLFGNFGRSEFTQYAVDRVERALKEIENSRQRTKIVIGIHTHVYDEIKESLKLNFLHQKSITVVMDNLSEAETLLIFKEQLTKGHCKMDPNCWFKTFGFQSVMDKLSKNQNHVGRPFLSLMYCNQHELFSDEDFSVNPIPTLVQYFFRMRLESPKCYDCLVYLMCVQQHTIEEEPETWAGQLSADITKHNLMDIVKSSGLLHVDTKRATLAHELLTTVLFKSLFKGAVIDIFFLHVLQKCDRDVFLQLLRPTDSTPSDLYVDIMFDKSDNSTSVGKMCAYKLAKIYPKSNITDNAHPLMKIELVEGKYYAYKYREPKNLPLI